ncbi:MAG: hypothetical protein ABI595_14795 [Actinomycetota bacterium]
MNLLHAHVHPWVTVAAGAAALALALMFLTGGYASVLRRRAGRPVPEGRPTKRYDANAVLQFIKDVGNSGWHVYRMQLIWDVVFAILLGVAGVVLADGILGLLLGPDSPWRFLSFLPALAGLADVAEDLLLLYGVGKVPAAALPHPGSVATAWGFTIAKFALHFAWLALVVVAAQRLIVLGPWVPVA